MMSKKVSRNSRKFQVTLLWKWRNEKLDLFVLKLLLLHLPYTIKKGWMFYYNVLFDGQGGSWIFCAHDSTRLHVFSCRQIVVFGGHNIDFSRLRTSVHGLGLVKMMMLPKWIKFKAAIFLVTFKGEERISDVE